MDTTLLALLLGSAIGLVLAFTGAGGGVLAIPMLVFGLHLPVQQAAPVGLVAVGLAAALGAVLGLKQGIVRYRAAALIGVAGMLIAPLGVMAAQLLPNRPLLAVFAVVLMFSAWRMRDKPTASSHEDKDFPCRVDKATPRLLWTRHCALALASTGLMSGVLSGLLGVGGGFVIVPALSRHTNLDIRSVQATSLAVIALVSISGVAAATMQGAVPWQICFPFAGGAIGGLLSGRTFAQRQNGNILRRAFSIFAMLVALLLLARAIGWIDA
jgi:uncharacterized membrane protein YfcA